jgi:hypothetical protein
VADRAVRFAPRRFERWTPAEDAVLLDCPAVYRELAVRLGRTVGAVKGRLLVLRAARRGPARA